VSGGDILPERSRTAERMAEGLREWTEDSWCGTAFVGGVWRTGDLQGPAGIEVVEQPSPKGWFRSATEGVSMLLRTGSGVRVRMRMSRLSILAAALTSTSLAYCPEEIDSAKVEVLSHDGLSSTHRTSSSS
jgi:hypothetical protein